MKPVGRVVLACYFWTRRHPFLAFAAWFWGPGLGLWLLLGQLVKHHAPDEALIAVMALGSVLTLWFAAPALMAYLRTPDNVPHHPQGTVPWHVADAHPHALRTRQQPERAAESHSRQRDH